MKENKPFTVSITEKGAKRAYPSIWYYDKAGQQFEVTKSKQWASIYEVISGKYSGRLISPQDCEKVITGDIELG